MKEKKREVLDEDTRFSLRFNNFWAIVVSVFMLGMSFAVIDKRLTLLSDKIDYQTNLLKQHLQEYREDFKQLQTRLGNDELKLKEIETRVGTR